MNYLVTGGAGYIGSHVVLKLIEQGHTVDIIDNLSRGCVEVLDCLKSNGWDGEFCKSDIGDVKIVGEFLKDKKYHCVLHFASYISVGESTKKPIHYFENNVAQFPRFLSSVVFHGTENFILSSSAAVYGNQKENTPIKETAELKPSSPYGISKVMLEQILESYAKTNPKFKYTSLRYFNVAGCNIENKIGDYLFDQKENLIPMCLSCAAGIREKISIYGTDYNTEDGTCIRDYIHVDDLADAHIKIINHLDNKCYNVGNGVGYSVRDIVDSCLKITGKSMSVIESERRSGDPDFLCADSSTIQNIIEWKPKITNIDDITRSAWEWIRKIRHLP
tara:strand:+ start:248 stop:1246 length:999 start_codon:yes stop_codon:yes gene_type:complete